MTPRFNIQNNLARLKLLAIAAMLLDHIAALYLQLHHNAQIEPFIRMPGRVAIPIFSFLVAYSYENLSRDKIHYALRLWGFAVISEPAYMIFFDRSGNAIFPLAIGITCLLIIDEVKGRWESTVLLMALSLIGLFGWAMQDISVSMGAILVIAFHRPVRDGWWAIWTIPIAIVLAMCNKWEWQYLAMIPVTGLLIYATIRTPLPPPTFRIRKWGGYWFYPAHLSLLAAVMHFLK